MAGQAALRRLGLGLMAIAMAVGLAACGGRGAGRQPVQALADEVWRFGLSHPDGFTLDIRTMQEPTEGIAVSYAATQGSHTRASLAKVVAHALGHDGYVGGWLDSESGLYYFDSSRLFPEEQRGEALRFAQENGQQTVYVISTGEEIRVGSAAQATPSHKGRAAPKGGAPAVQNSKRSI